MNWDMDSEEFWETLDDVLPTLKPQDYYFQMDKNVSGFGSSHYFVVVPKPYYDTNKCALSEHLGHLGIMPPGFDEDLEASFSYYGDPQAGRQLLLQAGFIEKKMF